MRINKKILIVTIIVFLSFSSTFSLYQAKNLENGTIPLAADENNIILCHFENDNLDSLGHPVSTYGDWFYNSTDPIVGSYSIQHNSNDRNHQKWYYTTDMPNGTIECFFMPTSLDNELSSLHILGIDDGFNNVAYVTTGNNGIIRANHVSNSGAEEVLWSSTVIEENVTYHIAYTWGSRGQELWINGVLENSSASTNGMKSTASYYGIGKTYEIVSSVSAIGIWDEFRLSNIQRSIFPKIEEISEQIPSAPVLNEVTSPDVDGNITLSWSAVDGASQYNVYRSDNPISEINGEQTLIITTSQLTCEDLNLPNGTYFYAMTAVNASGESLLSNCIGVIIAIPPEIPEDQSGIPGYHILSLLAFMYVSIRLLIRNKHKN